MFRLKKLLSWMQFRRKKAVMTMKIVIDAIVLLAMDQQIRVLPISNKSWIKTGASLAGGTLGMIASIPGCALTAGPAAGLANTVADAPFLKNEPILLGDVIKDDTTEEQKERLKELIASATYLKASSGPELFRKLKKDPSEQNVVLEEVFKFIKAEKSMIVVKDKD